MARAALNDPPYISRQVSEWRRFYLGTRPAEAADLSVICGGWERTKPDYVVRRDTFPWLAVEFVADGRGTLEIEGQRHRLETGSCFAYGPGIRLRIESDPRELLSKFYLNFVGRQASNLLAGVSLAPGTHRIVPDPTELATALNLLIADGAQTRPQTPMIVALQLHAVLLKLGSANAEEGGSDRRARQTLQKCLDYIEQHYLDTVTAEEVARACHVSTGHMSRLFGRYGYNAPYDYLVRRKMQHAAELFDSGNLLVREVADRLGLDPFQFSRVFKRVHGLSPSQFVARHGDTNSASLN
mgnify:FL=1